MYHIHRLRELAVAAIVVCAACSSVKVTPNELRDAHVPQAERNERVEAWTLAVGRCNEFLASPYRHALPTGRIVLDDSSGMRFESDGRVWPLEVRCTSWGDVVQSFGFAAQERAYGFTVGDCPPAKDRVADNGLFRDSRGFVMDSDLVADLILHEATHVVSGEGALGFWKSAGYYCEAFFLFRYGRTHSDERRAYSTGEEYHAFIQSVGREDAVKARLLTQLEEHIAHAPAKECRHDTKLSEP